MKLPPHITSIVNLIRKDLAFIGHGVEAVHRTLNQYVEGIEKERDRQNNQKDVPAKVVAEVHLPDSVEAKRAADQESQHTTEQIIAIAAWGAFIGALLYAGVAALQWREMRTQTAELFRQSEIENAGASHRAVETFRQLNIAQEQAKAAQLQAQAAAKNAQAAQAIVVAVREGIEESSKRSKEVLDAAIATSHLEERPWVGVILGNTQGGVQTQDTFSFRDVTILVRNSGKTPAVKMSGRTMMLSHLWTDPIGDYDSEMKGWKDQRDALLKRMVGEHRMPPPPPGWEAEQKAIEASADKELFPEGGVIPPEAVNEWHIPGGSFGRRAERMTPMALYIFGKITYYDTVGGPQHTTKFCLKHLQGDSFTICPNGNWMD